MKVAIVLLTAKTHEDRARYAKATLSSLTKLHTTHELQLFIGDDGSGKEYQDELISVASSIGFNYITITDSNKHGYGANYNRAMAEAQRECELILPLEDDWELTHEFDLDPIVNVLRDGVFDSVRMGYVGYTQELRAKFVWCNNLHWLELDPDSHEPHVFSGHPRLETVAYQKRVGPWPEDLTPGETEWFVATQLKEARKRVAIPIGLHGDLRDGIFAHIGTVKSY